MAKFRCPKCGFVFEGEKDACPKCGVHFKKKIGADSQPLNRKCAKDLCKLFESAKTLCECYEQMTDNLFKDLDDILDDVRGFAIYSSMKNMPLSGIREEALIERNGINNYADLFKHVIIDKKTIRGATKEQFNSIKKQVENKRDYVANNLSIDITDSNKTQYKPLIIHSSILDIITALDEKEKNSETAYKETYLAAYNYLKDKVGIFAWSKNIKRDKVEMQKNYSLLASNEFKKIYDTFKYRIGFLESLFKKPDAFYVDYFCKNQEFITKVLSRVSKMKITSNLACKEVNKKETVRETQNTPQAGVSVTNRIKVVQQPRLGYLKIKDMEKIQLKSLQQLHDDCKVSPQSIGLAVDYLTRFMSGATVSKAFQISFLGAQMIDDLQKAKKIAANIKGLDDKSINSVLQLIGYDAVFRAGYPYKADLNWKADAHSILDVREMVRGLLLLFFKKYGPVILDGFTFEGGYTKTVSYGDGDFLTKDTLWDFKVSKHEPNSKQTLQILMYYLMGKHSIHKEFKAIRYVGIYNPRLNVIYRYDVGKMSPLVIKEIEKNVIGY